MTDPRQTPQSAASAHPEEIAPLAQQFATRRARREWERAHPGEAFPGLTSAATETVQKPSVSTAAADDAATPSAEDEPAAPAPVPHASSVIPALTDEEHSADPSIPPDDEAFPLGLFDGDSGTGDTGSEKPENPHHRRRWIVGILSGTIALILVLTGLFFAKGIFSSLTGSDDYTGSGTGEVLFTVTEGDTGSTIANNLVKAHVIKSYRPFLDAYNQISPAPVFFPGAYQLKKQMPAAKALNILKNKNNIVSATVVIPEGFTEAQILARVAARTGLRLSSLKQTAANVTSFGLPSNAPSLEGYLFPATYQFKPGVTATQILTTMVQRTRTALAQAGVSWDSAYQVLTLASIVQKEAGTTADMPKVARVFQNRLDQGMKLQSDATVSYGAGSSSITTTAAQRADASNKYNTYANAGLPLGPISNPGDDAIAAAVNPAAGSWLYFTTVNPTTGETRFENTPEEHEQNVKVFQQWLKEHGDQGNK